MYGCKLQSGIGEITCWNGAHTYQLYLNVPTVSHSAYNAREREVRCCVEAVVKESCEKVLICEEKKYNQIEKDGVVEMAASYDMGWQQRGKGHNQGRRETTLIGGGVH